MNIRHHGAKDFYALESTRAEPDQWESSINPNSEPRKYAWSRVLFFMGWFLDCFLVMVSFFVSSTTFVNVSTPFVTNFKLIGNKGTRFHHWYVFQKEKIFLNRVSCKIRKSLARSASRQFHSTNANLRQLTITIKDDLHLTQDDIANSNIVALLATLLVRFLSGPLCDRFGPRRVFAGLLLAGSIPSICAGGATSASGLIAIRFFVGILGGTFVPCQVWSTGFFDRNVVGTSNSLIGGWGNSGGGIT